MLDIQYFTNTQNKLKNKSGRKCGVEEYKCQQIVGSNDAPRHATVSGVKLKPSSFEASQKGKDQKEL